MPITPTVPHTILARSFLAGLSLLLTTVAAPSRLVAEGSLQPEGWDTSMRLREAQDLNPDPHIVETNIEARVANVQLGPGKLIDAWTYDGGLPGPLIRAHVGDRVIVHFLNDLPQATTIHWHGIRLP